MKKKNKKRNNKRIIIITIISLVVLLLGYKLFMYYKYTCEKPEGIEEVIAGLKNSKTIKISKKVLPENEYVTKKHFKMKNIMDGYILDESNITTSIDIYRKEIDGKSSVIQFGADEESFQLVDAFVEDDITIYGDYGLFKGSINDADRKGFLEKNNIKNDIDFYKFVADNYYLESNIFTDIKTLKQNYAFNLFVSIAVPKIAGWTILEGDINGYIMNVGTKDDISVFHITIIDNGKRYGILTNDPRFKDESFVIDLISTIEIVDK